MLVTSADDTGQSSRNRSQQKKIAGPGIAAASATCVWECLHYSRRCSQPAGTGSRMGGRATALERCRCSWGCLARAAPHRVRRQQAGMQPPAGAWAASPPAGRCGRGSPQAWRWSAGGTFEMCSWSSCGTDRMTRPCSLARCSTQMKQRCTAGGRQWAGDRGAAAERWLVDDARRVAPVAGRRGRGRRQEVRCRCAHNVWCRARSTHPATRQQHPPTRQVLQPPRRVALRHRAQHVLRWCGVGMVQATVQARMGSAGQDEPRRSGRPGHSPTARAAHSPTASASNQAARTPHRGSLSLSLSHTHTHATHTHTPGTAARCRGRAARRRPPAPRAGRST